MQDPITSDSARPAVSVVMPAFNAARHLSEAVDSILAQTLEDFEFIIVEDGSTDETPALLESYAQHDRRIRVIRNPANLGVVASLNVGLEAARGRYIARIDADDIAAPTRLAAQAAFLDAHPDYALIGARCRTIDDAGRALKIDDHAQTPELCAWTVFFRIPFPHPTYFFRRSAVDAGFRYRGDYRHAEDLDFAQRLLRLGRGRALDALLLDYRMHPTNVSTRHAAAQRAAHVEACVAYALSHWPEGSADEIRALFAFVICGGDVGVDAVLTAAGALEARFLASQSIEPAVERRIRLFTARQLAFGALRAGLHRRPARMAHFLWRARAYWPRFGAEAIEFIARRRAAAADRPTSAATPAPSSVS